MKISKRVVILIIVLLLATGSILYKAGNIDQTHACGWVGCSVGNTTFLEEQKAIEKNQQKLDSIEQLPQMTDSLERKNLIKRAQTFNNPNKISYIYLYSFGRLIMYDTVKGKVSALDSSLTSQKQFVDSSGGLIGNGNNCIQSNDNCYSIPAPAIDGSYGTNGTGIFYYNENGAYREWNGQYILSDQPFTLTNQPDLVKSVQ